MKITIYFILSLAVGLSNAFAQSEPPTPPPTPATSEHSEKSTSKSVTSINVDGSYSYFSTTDSEEDFKVKAKFDGTKNAKILGYLLEELGRKNLTNSGSKHVWKVTYSGDTAYEVRLDKGSLRIYLDKELAPSGVENKIKTIAKNVKSYTSGSNEKRDKERMKREADRKLREADRLKREADRLKREAERLEREAKKKTRNR